MAADRVYNFSAGPSMLPIEVLEQAGREILNFGGSGTSVMEMSHRSKAFISIFEETKAHMRRLLSVPETHEILFLQGGGTLQFAMAPMNLISKTGKADYAITGNFSNLACKEAKKFGDIAVAASSEDRNHTYIPKQSDLMIREDASYFYYCANNTIYGTEWHYVPESPVPLVCDMSSNILTKPVDFSKYDVVFAGAQKNMAPAGLTVVFVRKDCVGKALPFTPVMLDYAAMIKGDSMHNTPPCWPIYILGLVLKWMDGKGGLEGMQKIKADKARILYDVIDSSSLFKGCADRDDRSDMNVTFVTGDAELDKRFAKEAEAAGFVNVAGHRNVGGMRASIYNAMPVEGVRALAEFMREFERKM